MILPAFVKVMSTGKVQVWLLGTTWRYCWIGVRGEGFTGVVVSQFHHDCVIHWLAHLVADIAIEWMVSLATTCEG